MTIRCLAVAALLLGALPATAQRPRVRLAPAAAADEEILSRLHRINTLEMRMGEVAMRKGRSVRLQRYGRVLFRDHRLMERHAADVARRLELEFSSLEDKKEAAIAMLEEASEAEFDRRFTETRHVAHREWIELLESARQSRSPAVRDLVERLLPILRQHDELALKLGAPEKPAGGPYERAS